MKLNIPDAAAVVVAMILAAAMGVAILFAAAGCQNWAC